MFACLWARRAITLSGNADFLSAGLVFLSARCWSQTRSPAPTLSLPLRLSPSLSSCLSRAAGRSLSFPQSPPSPPTWVAAMGRKQLITDSYPVVKRREGPAGHSKGELATELEAEIQPLSVDEEELELLRQFDLAWQFGPCTGITRLQRWHRAKQMGLEPPPEVHQSLASLSPLRCHVRSPACYSRTSGHKQEPVAAPQLSSAVKNIWQEGVSQGRKEADFGGLRTQPSLQQASRAPLRTAEDSLHRWWSLRIRTWPWPF
ncbi:DNA polymerase delta subunit 4 isoform 1-T1 [Molossus nigricans]